MIAAFRMKRTLNNILDHLDRERAVMVSGDLPQLTSLVEERERMVNALLAATDQLEPQHNDVIAKIQEKTRRNAALMQSSLAGLRDAEAVLARIREQQSRLGTYDSGGNVEQTAVVKPKHERRA